MNHLATDVRAVGSTVHFLPVLTRVPLEFGTETLTSVTCARIALRVRRQDGSEATGWGETPLSVQWAWPSLLAYEKRHQAMKDFCLVLARLWAQFSGPGFGYRESEIARVLPPAAASF